jgi:uncharacterized protein involved in exopolysaccharide biosynthesis/Mrp family chromosome partitioning ATPase
MIDEKKGLASPTFKVADFIELIFRGKWTIILFTFLGFLAAGALYFKTPPMYQSVAKLFIRYVSESTRIEPKGNGENVVTPSRDGEGIINSELEILTSLDLIETVIQDIGPERFASVPPGSRASSAIAYGVAQNLSVEIPKKSCVLRLSFNASSPELAQTFLNKLIESYLRKHVAIHSELGVSDFLSRQTDQMRSRLAETEEQLRRLRNSAGIISMADARMSVARRIDLLKSSIQDAEVSLASAQARLDLMEGPVAAKTESTNMLTQGTTVASAARTNVETSVERDDHIYAVQLYERFREQQQRESAMLAVYTADSQPVRSLRSQIEETRKLLASLPIQKQPIVDMVPGVTNVQNETTVSEMEVVSLKAKIKALREGLDQSRIEAQQIDKAESDIMELQRSKEIQEVNYRYFVQTLEQARIDNTLNAQNFSNISIVQPATLPGIKIRPKQLPKTMAMVVAMGLFCGLGLAYLKGLVLNQTFKRPQELEAALRIPVIISIPYMHSLNGPWHKVTAKRKHKRAVVFGAGDPLAEAPIWNTFRELEDYFETLKYRLLAATHSASEKPFVVAFTSCFPGAGVTTLATGLALTLAHDSNDRVLLVDANFGQPAAQKLLGISPEKGLMDIMATGNGEVAAVRQNLYFLPPGRSGEEMPEKDFSLSLAKVIRSFKERPYRFVLFDTAPVTDTRFALRICQMMDRVILVIDADKTDRAAVSRATQILNRGVDRTLGIVFNKKHYYTPRWLSLPT